MWFRHGKGRAHLPARDWRKPALLLLRRTGRFEQHHVAVIGRRGMKGHGAKDRAAHRLVANRQSDLTKPEPTVFGLQLRAPEPLLPCLAPHGSEHGGRYVLMLVMGCRVGFERHQLASYESRNSCAEVLDLGGYNKVHGVSP